MPVPEVIAGALPEEIADEAEHLRDRFDLEEWVTDLACLKQDAYQSLEFGCGQPAAQTVPWWR